MRVVLALGGNALLLRGAAPAIAPQVSRARDAIAQLAPLAATNQVVITHGNGPQVGVMAQESPDTPFDTLVAQTQGMIGYWLVQALQNHLGANQAATVLTQVVVSPDDPAFSDPTKFVGQAYSHEEASRLARENGWVVRADGKHFRRVIASPTPRRCLDLDLIASLLDAGRTVVCAGGGGIPVFTDEEGNLHGAEAVIDKDLTAAMLGIDLETDRLIILTDVPGIIKDFGTPAAALLPHAAPEELRQMNFSPGSMGPKVEAVCHFVEATGKTAAIGALGDAAGLVAGTSGTQISPNQL